MYFCLNKMSIDGVIMNRVLPAEVNDHYFEAWKKNQKQYMEKAREYFSPIPVFSVNLFKGEVLGYDQLKVLAERIYKGLNPLDHFYFGEPYELVKEDGQYRLVIRLPFIAGDDVDLNRISNELFIRIGNFKRNILLPRQVAASASVTAKYEGQNLYILFKGDRHGKR